MRLIIFVPLMLMAAAAQASPALPSQAAYDSMTCNQAVSATMKIMRRQVPEWRWMPDAQLRKEALAEVRAVETAYPHRPCLDPQAAAPNSAPSVPTRAGKAGR